MSPCNGRYRVVVVGEEREGWGWWWLRKERGRWESYSSLGISLPQVWWEYGLGEMR